MRSIFLAVKQHIKRVNKCLCIKMEPNATKICFKGLHPSKALI